MPRCTLREYLSYTNPSFILRPPITYSTRDPPSSWPTVDSWQKWDDFNIGTINALFGNLLDTEFTLAELPSLPSEQLHIRDERTFEFIVGRWNNAIVNEALRAASEHLGLERVCWIVGSLVHPSEDTTESDIRPDWAAVTPGILANPERWASLVPGDTKFIKQSFPLTTPGTSDTRSLDSEGFFYSSPLDSEARLNRKNLQSCLQQINYYALRYHTRYCYIISNKELLVVRRTADPPSTASKSLAQNRERRYLYTRDTTPTPVPPQSASRFQFSSSPLSQGTQLPSSPYTDHGRPETNMADPDVLSIPWTTTGDLTINLALFVLHMLAGLACDVRDEYPDIDKDPDYLGKLNRRKSKRLT